MAVFKRRFRHYFTEVVDHAYKAFTLEDFKPEQRLSSFVRDINELASSLAAHHCLSREDIEQELVIIWLQLRENWLGDAKLQERCLGNYIAGLSPWILRDRIVALSRPDRIVDKHIPEKPLEPNVQPLNRDLRFLMFGSDEWPFSILDPYERNLLYLRLLRGMPVYKMAKLLQKDRAFVKSKLDSLTGRIRRLLNEDCKPNTDLARDVRSRA